MDQQINSQLNNRQSSLLKAIISEYVETAEPVGSLQLEKKYNLGVSPATLRNEMANLTKTGYLKQPHTSAGRVPTPMAMKFYITQLMEEKQMSVVDEVKTKENVWDYKNDFDRLMQQTTQALADKTHSLAVAATEDGDLWRSGHGYVFDNPEFFDRLVAQSVFSYFDESARVHNLLFERFTGLSPIEILFGEELGYPNFDKIGVVGTRFSAQGKQGALAIIGPFRQEYAVCIPTMRYFRALLEELLI